MQMCPVDTGALRSSIFLERERKGFVLGASASYAVFNEYGSISTPLGKAKYHGQRPFLRPSAYKAMRIAPDVFNDYFEKIVGHGGGL